MFVYSNVCIHTHPCFVFHASYGSIASLWKVQKLQRCRMFQFSCSTDELFILKDNLNVDTCDQRASLILHKGVSTWKILNWWNFRIEDELSCGRDYWRRATPPPFLSLITEFFVYTLHMMSNIAAIQQQF